ncbi:MAG: alginate O-acetyltransferase AlgX-related protein [Planctomycetota bacterium]
MLIINGLLSKKKVENQKQKREDLFKTIVLVVSVILCIIVADISLRLLKQKRYVGNKTSYHRAPNKIIEGINKDVPITAFTYPLAHAGYQDVSYTITVDKRGFRNTTDLDTYDVVTLGDSFTEGSHVSDEHAWPIVFSNKSNLTVYNLGMSGGSPLTYLDTLEKYGLALSPKIVICTIYEGNDFRGSNFEATKEEKRVSLKSRIKSSPLRNAIKNGLIRLFGPVNSKRFSKNTANLDSPSHPMYAVSWLPVGIPQASEAKYYAFKIKRLLAHFDTKDNIQKSFGCQGLIQYLREINRTCKKNNIRFIIMYVPDKPHVVLPLLKNRLSANQVHAFLSLKAKNLPEPDELMEILYLRLEAHESIIEELCREDSIEFISLTESLQQEMLKGRQVYYTYDQHWTPLGQLVAAETLANYLQGHPQK